MGVFNWLVSRMGYEKIAEPVGGLAISRFLSGKPYMPEVRHDALVKKYASWVYVCSSKNANSCTQVPLRLYTAKPSRGAKCNFRTRKLRKGNLKWLGQSPSAEGYMRKAVEVEEVLEHPFLELLSKVNDFMNRYDLMEMKYLAEELTGNAYWYLELDEGGLPVEIWPLFPQFMHAVVDKQKYISHWLYGVNRTERVRFELEQVVHFKYANPKSSIYGMGPLEACVIAADLSNNMNLTETALFKNRGVPDYALIIPPEAGVPSEDEQKRMLTEWGKKFKGVQKSGKMTIMTGGAELKQVSLSPKEMAYLKGRQWSREEICAVYGVPLSKVTTDKVNRANAEAGDYSYMKDTILPRLQKTEQKLNEKLMPMYDERLFVVYDNPVPADKDYRLKEIETRLKVGFTSINEERQADGLEEVEWGEVPLLPMNMIPVGAAPAVGVVSDDGKARNDTRQIGGDVLPTINARPSKSPRRMPPLEHPTNFINEEFEASMARYYRDVGKDVLANFDRDADFFKRYKPAVKDPRAGDFASGWFDMQKWNTELALRKEPFIRRTMMAGGDRSLRRLTTEVAFNGDHPKAIEALTKHRLGSVQSTNGTIAKSLRSKLAIALEEGIGAAPLRKVVQEVFVGLENFAATRIARTETIWAFNEGAVQGYIQSGVVEKKVWVSSDDDRSCEFCPTLNNTVVGVEGNYFDKGGAMTGREGGQLDFQYEDIGHPPIHPNCRCAIAPVIEVI